MLIWLLKSSYKFIMGTGTRQTFYFKTLKGMRCLAEEEGIDLNGSLLEELFWDRYTGTDSSYSACMEKLYDGSRDLKRTLAGILEIMAYSDEHMVKDNINFMRIVRDCIGSSGWDDKGENYTDYSIDNKWRFVDTLADIFSIIAAELEQRKYFVENDPIMHGIDPWDISRFPTMDKRREQFLSNKANYEENAIETFLFRGNSLKEEFTGNASPGRVLELIIENWDYFWNYSSTYEAAEYCITLSDISDRPLLRTRMRKFFQEMSKRQHTVSLTVESFIKDAGGELAALRLLEYQKLLRSKE